MSNKMEVINGSVQKATLIRTHNAYTRKDDSVRRLEIEIWDESNNQTIIFTTPQLSFAQYGTDEWVNADYSFKFNSVLSVKGTVKETRGNTVYLNRVSRL